MLKCLVTIDAHKWLFYYVGIIMLIQKKALFKCLFKLCVCTWLLSSVDLLMGHLSVNASSKL